MYIGPDETKLGQEDFFKIDGKTAKSHEKHAVFSALDQLLTQELFWKDIQKDQGLHKASKYEGVFGCLCFLRIENRKTLGSAVQQTTPIL